MPCSPRAAIVAGDLGGRPSRPWKSTALVDRDMTAVPLGGQAPLVLHGTRQDHPPLSQAAVIRLRKLRGPASYGCPSSRRWSTSIAALCGAYGRTVKVSGSGTRRPHRAHPLDGLELVQGVHGLHGHGETDPGADPVAQPLHVGGLAADDAAVVAIKEPTRRTAWVRQVSRISSGVIAQATRSPSTPPCRPRRLGVHRGRHTVARS